jgi:hypothetical protein
MRADSLKVLLALCALLTLGFLQVGCQGDHLDQNDLKQIANQQAKNEQEGTPAKESVESPKNLRRGGGKGSGEGP